MSEMDTIIKISGSTIQHGRLNNRVYLMDYCFDDIPEVLIDEMELLVEKNGYTKIFCKIPDFVFPLFRRAGYLTEAFIPRYYNNRSGCFFVSKFYQSREKIIKEEESFFGTVSDLVRAAKYTPVVPAQTEVVVRPMLESECEKIAGHLGSVFRLYPFPVSDPGYILETMRSGTVYFGAYIEEALAGVSSAERYIKSGSVEMTDFAVLPEFRGMKIGTKLLLFMEDWIKHNTDISVSYTIARLREPGMNVVFLKGGYIYTGTLINNTYIFNGIESMNVYYKSLKS